MNERSRKEKPRFTLTVNGRMVEKQREKEKGGIAIKGRNTGYEIRAPCVMEMWITGYSAMENAIHSTWKSREQLSHVLQTAFPTAP